MATLDPKGLSTSSVYIVRFHRLFLFRLPHPSLPIDLTKRYCLPSSVDYASSTFGSSNSVLQLPEIRGQVGNYRGWNRICLYLKINIAKGVANGKGEKILSVNGLSMPESEVEAKLDEGDIQEAES